MFGKKHTEETKRKIARWKRPGHLFKKWMKSLKRGVEASNWKGEDAAYGTIHAYIKRWFGNAVRCELCRTKNKRKIKMKNGRVRSRFEWSNKTGIYNRERKNWWQLCILCHRRFDKKNPKRPHKRIKELKNNV
jgi:hypothetical protein